MISIYKASINPRQLLKPYFVNRKEIAKQVDYSSNNNEPDHLRLFPNLNQSPTKSIFPGFWNLGATNDEKLPDGWIDFLPYLNMYGKIFKKEVNGTSRLWLFVVVNKKAEISGASVVPIHKFSLLYKCLTEGDPEKHELLKQAERILVHSLL